MELETDEQYPLGIQRQAVYAGREVQLKIGDCVVFFSDGMVEATNADRDAFGYARLKDTIQWACTKFESASDILNHIRASIDAFTGNMLEADDQTCIVMVIQD